MDYEQEFLDASSTKDMETIKYYFDNEREFMTARNFYTTNLDTNTLDTNTLNAMTLNILYRMHAVSVIAKVTKKDDPDAYVPYLAMNYFDRFMPHCNMTHVEGQTDSEKIRLIAISCFTLSAKMRTESFSVEQFLSDLYVTNRDMNLTITPSSLSNVMTMELLIQKKLDWKMQSVTPFCFLNHYYPYFKPLGDVKRRSINQIIVAAQGFVTTTEFKPSEIALCAIAAAATKTYPSKKFTEDCERLFKMGRPNKVARCRGLIDEIGKKINTQIDTPSSGIDSASSKVVAVHQTETKKPGTLKIKEIQQNNIMAVDFADSSEEEEDGTALIDKRRQGMGKTETSQLKMKEKLEDLFDKKDVAAEESEAEKQSLAKGEGKGMAVEKVKEPQPQMEGSIPEIEPKKFMNFELNWETDVASLEVGIGHPQQPRESTGIIRIPGTGININLGCCSCNIL